MQLAIAPNVETLFYNYRSLFALFALALIAAEYPSEAAEKIVIYSANLPSKIIRCQNRLTDSTVQNSTLFDSEYASISDMSRNLIAKFPPKSNYILGIGRSPTTIIAFLQNYRQNYAKNLPLSSFRHRVDGPHKYSIPGHEFKYVALTPIEENILFDHFDRFIPSDLELNGRRLILLDYAKRGDNLFAAHEYLQKYVTVRKRNLKVINAVMVEQSNIEAVTQRASFSKQSIHIFSLPENKIFTSKLKHSEYDDYSEYSPFVVKAASNHPIGQVSSSLKARPEFIRLYLDIARRMASDPYIR